MAEGTDLIPQRDGPPVDLGYSPEDAELEPQGSETSEPSSESSMKMIDTNASSFPDGYLGIPLGFKNKGSGHYLNDQLKGYLKQTRMVWKPQTEWYITKTRPGQYAIRHGGSGTSDPSIVVYPNHVPYLNTDRLYDQHGWYTNALWNFETAADGSVYIINQSAELSGYRIDVKNNSNAHGAELKVNPYIASGNRYQRWSVFMH